MPSQTARYGLPWTREETILAFELYCRIPFRRTKANNPKIQELAKLLDRTSASIARKLGNFGRFDPELKRQNISGLSHGSKLDQQVWNEFHSNWNDLIHLAHELKSSLSYSAKSKPEPVKDRPKGPSERIVVRKQRIHQAFFREAILSNYEATCAVTGISFTNCLIASHIVPWSANANLRTDPTNGLCLSATFDKLFDNGLMTINSDFKIILSSQVLKSDSPRDQYWILAVHEQKLRLPHRFLPSPHHLLWHTNNVFLE